MHIGRLVRYQLSFLLKFIAKGVWKLLIIIISKEEIRVKKGT